MSSTPPSAGPYADAQTPYVSFGIEDDATALIDTSYPRSTNDAAHARFDSRRAGSSFFKWWLFELLASVISVSSLIAQVMVLRHYSGRGLQDLNLPYSLTINGVVAAISTINRVAWMVPVSAAISQEAWLWFSSQKGTCRSRFADLEDSDAASRGAWGSFILMSKTRRSYLAFLGAVVTILTLAFGPFTQQLLSVQNYAFTGRGNLPGPGNIPRSQTWQEVAVDIEQAVFSGIRGVKSSALPLSCESGNCTWPVTPTLAVCGECSRSSYQTSCDSTICNYTTPAGTVMNSSSTGALIDATLAFQVNSIAGVIYHSSPKDRVFIANFEVFGVPNEATTWNHSNVVASECALWVCIQGFSVHTVSSQQTQSSVWNFSQTVNSSYIGTAKDNVTFAPLPLDKSLGVGASYTFSLGAWQALSTDFLQPVFTGGIFFLDQFGEYSSSPWVDAIRVTSTDLNPWISNLALSMTNVIRAGTPASDPAYDGTAFQLGISVRWWWITLPAAMVALSLTFLIITMVKTAKSRVGAWKGRPLMLLFSDVEGEIKDKVNGQMNRCGGLRETVGRERVVLENLPSGNWLFKAA